MDSGVTIECSKLVCSCHKRPYPSEKSVSYERQDNDGQCDLNCGKSSLIWEVDIAACVTLAQAVAG